jgi:hypothetical protein
MFLNDPGPKRRRMTFHEMGVASDVRMAARRRGVRQCASQHPVGDINDATAQTMDEEHPLTRAEAGEMMIVARWPVYLCGTADAAISGISRKFC